MGAMNISIAMTTYNGAKYLREQLDSFVDQTRLPDELVVCDDNSCDSTMGILHNFATTAPFKVRIIQNEYNLGYIKNFEKALSLCTGDLIFLSDQDDVWLSQKIETMSQRMAKTPQVQVLLCDMILAEADLTPTKFTQMGNIIAASGKKDSFYSGCCMLIRRHFLNIVLPLPDRVFAHDNWINHLALALEGRDLIPVPLQLYRRHGKNASNSILSSTEGASQLRLIRAADLSSAESGWQDQLERYHITRKRLSAADAVLARLGLADHHSTGLSYLSRRISNLEARLKLASKPRLLRWPRVFVLWSRGGYSDFIGWKSAVKDIFRP